MKINQARKDMELQKKEEADSNDTTPLNTGLNTPHFQPNPQNQHMPPISHATTSSPGTKAIPIQGSSLQLSHSDNITMSSLSTTGSVSRPTHSPSRASDAYLSSSFASTASSEAFDRSPSHNPSDSLVLHTVQGENMISADGSLHRHDGRHLGTTGITAEKEPGYHPPLDVASSSEDDYDIEQIELTPSTSQLPDIPLSTLSISPAAVGASTRSSKTAIHPDPHRIVMCGYLMKQGKRKTWRKRWFTLTNQKLMYSRSHIVSPSLSHFKIKSIGAQLDCRMCIFQDSKINRSIPLDRILDAMEYIPTAKTRVPAGPLSPMLPTGEIPNSPTQEGHKRPPANCFKIITPSRTFVVSAPSEEDEIKWLSGIRVLIAAARKPLNSPSLELSHLSWPAQQPSGIPPTTPAGASYSRTVVPSSTSGNVQHEQQSEKHNNQVHRETSALNSGAPPYPSIESKFVYSSAIKRPDR